MFQKIAATPTLILMAIIITSGILGGIVNYPMNNFPKPGTIIIHQKPAVCILFSAIVMFILEVTATDLIKKQPAIDYVVSGCICLLCSIVLSIAVNAIIVKFPQMQNDRTSFPLPV